MRRTGKLRGAYIAVAKALKVPHRALLLAAKRAGITVALPRRGPWSAAEVGRLRWLWCSGASSPMLLKGLPGRTAGAIGQRAKLLGLSKDRSEYVTLTEAARRLGVHRDVVHRLLQQHKPYTRRGLTRNGTVSTRRHLPWSRVRAAYIQSLQDRYTLADVAREAGAHPAALRRVLSAKGLVFYNGRRRTYFDKARFDELVAIYRNRPGRRTP